MAAEEKPARTGAGRQDETLLRLPGAPAHGLATTLLDEQGEEILAAGLAPAARPPVPPDSEPPGLPADSPGISLEADPSSGPAFTSAARVTPVQGATTVLSDPGATAFSAPGTSPDDGRPAGARADPTAVSREATASQISPAQPDQPPPTAGASATQRRATAPIATPGTVLSGRYQLEELLGQGGMGLVFRATDLRMKDSQVAVKLLKAELLLKQPALLPILQESVRKSRLLPHPNIASVYSLESDGPHDYVIMELMRGQTLQSLLDGEYARGLPITLARTLIADLCGALAYAHDHSVIHSDIKPSNIFITPAGRAKLFDFDIARVTRGPAGYFDPSQVRAVTFAYATIEMVEGKEPDPRDDVYALACVIHEMLSGRHPFASLSALAARSQNMRPAPLPALRPRENQALAAALSFEREQRLPGVEALQKAFSAAGPTVPRFGLRAPPSLPPKLRPRLPRSPRSLWALGFVGTLLCALLGWYLLASPVQPTPIPAVPMESAGVPSASPPGVPPLAVELNRAQTLALRATALAVDVHDGTLQHAVALLSGARVETDPGKALQLALEGVQAYQAVLARAPRSAQLGSSEKQIAEAMVLCRQTPLHCSPGDLADETPRSVSLPPFALDTRPVTRGEFARFVEATGYRTAAETGARTYEPDAVHAWDVVVTGRSWRTEGGTSPEADALPVLGMDLESAGAYCRWKGQRLPTEDEWEYMARGPSAQVFPWGDQPEPPAPLPDHVLPVEAAAPQAFAPRGLGGNIAEWTQTRIAGQRVLRGGSFRLRPAYFQRLALRRNPPAGSITDSGFRCAVSLESWPDSASAERPRSP